MELSGKKKGKFRKKRRKKRWKLRVSGKNEIGDGAGPGEQRGFRNSGNWRKISAAAGN